MLTNGKWADKGGWPVRRLVEISGNTSAGKSLLANHALIETQKMGGIPILFDEENSTDVGLLVKMGLRIGKDAEDAGLHKLVYLSAGSVEKVFDTIEAVIKKTRELGSKAFITIVWDSIAATPSNEELEGSFEKEGYGTGKALAISKAMRKVTQFIGREDVLLIFCNQLRAGIGGPAFGDKWVTPGGNAVPFHSSIRLRLTKITDIKRQDAVVGITVQAQLKKNKIAPPARRCTFDIYFDKGIDDESSWMENLVAKGVIRRPTKITYEIDLPSADDSISVTKFKSSEWLQILADPKIRAYVRQLVVKANTIDYSNLSPSFDELVETGIIPEKGEVSETGDLIDQ
jgi:recombination protein RecA